MKVNQWSARIAKDANLTVRFSDAIATIDAKYISLREIDSSGNESTTPIPIEIKSEDNLITINPSADLTSGRDYSIVFSKGAITAVNGDSFPAGTLSASSFVVSALTSDQGYTRPVDDFPYGDYPTYGDYPKTTPPYTPTTATYAISDVTVTEGNSGNITITRSGDTSSQQTISITSNDVTATGGTDYKPVNTNVTFKVGEVIKTIPINTIDDTAAETSETFEILGGTITGGTPTTSSSWANNKGTVTIADNDTARIKLIITTSKSVVDEGDGLTTTISGGADKAGSLVYWSITGDGIDKYDFAKGSLTGSGVLDGNGTLSISHTLKEDQSNNEGDEQMYIAVFADPTRTKLLAPSVGVLINDTSAVGEDENNFRTFDSEVQEYKVGSAKSDRIIVSTSERFKTWALWGEDGDDTLIGGTKGDYLIGGNGIDSLTGGKGGDTFVMSDYSQRSYDIIKDFVAKDDVIGISSNLIDASEDETIALMRFKDVKNKESAERFFKNKPADRYIVVDTTDNINQLNSSGYTEKVLLAVDLTRKAVLYDVDGRWNQGSDVLCKFTGKMSFDSWSSDNFALGIDVV